MGAAWTNRENVSQQTARITANVKRRFVITGFPRILRTICYRGFARHESRQERVKKNTAQNPDYME
jgi:hypothetical protein